jgi:hypothetical protein
VCLYSFLRCLAQRHLSNMGLTLLAILTMKPHALGDEDFIMASGYIGSASLKTLHPYGLPL